MEILGTNIPTDSFESLSNLAQAELEQLKQQLDQMRQQILALQNARSPLLRLPGELRNHIWHYAMLGTLEARQALLRPPGGSSAANFFGEPDLFRTCRRIRAECTGAWFVEVAVWEEWDADTGQWQRLGGDEVRELLGLRSKLGKCRVVTQMAYCDLERAREAVVESGSVCPRRGLVRVEGARGLPRMRWWVW